MGPSFRFIGFEPTPALKNFAHSLFGLIENESPSDSAAHAVIQKKRDGFEAALKIHSLAGTFMAEVLAEDPQKALVDLTRHIRTQLRNWKRTRFSDMVDASI